jgi:Glyoxalase-like domain
MTLKDIVGIDHAVVLVRDLDQGAAAWQRLGFTVSPRGTHSPQMGSGNYTIMLGPDYIELLGIIAETPHNAPSRAFLARRGEGIERIAFTTTDAAAGAAEIRRRGYEPIGPIDFGRPVQLPGGGEAEARFSVFQWPVDEAPGGLRIFACQHKTREAVWIPELQKHANGAQRLEAVLIVSPEPKNDAEHLARLIDVRVEPARDGAFRVPSGSDRAEFVFMTRDVLATRYDGVALEGVPERGGAGLVIVVDDFEAAAKAAGGAGVRASAGVLVPPAAANGVLLAFVTR